MTYVRELLDRHPAINLEFVRRQGGTSVHVAMPKDPDVEPELVDVTAMTELSAFEAYLNLCGRAVHVYYDDSGPYKMVGTFADTDLCCSCHRVLGPTHSDRAMPPWSSYAP